MESAGTPDLPSAPWWCLLWGRDRQTRPRVHRTHRQACVSRTFFWFLKGDKLSQRGGHLPPGVTGQEESRPLPVLGRECPPPQPPRGLQASGFGGETVWVWVPCPARQLLSWMGGLRSVPVGCSPLPRSAPRGVLTSEELGRFAPHDQAGARNRGAAGSCLGPGQALASAG